MRRGSLGRWGLGPKLGDRPGRHVPDRCVIWKGDPGQGGASQTKRLPLPRSVAITSCFSSRPTLALSATASTSMQRSSFDPRRCVSSAYVSLRACAVPRPRLLAALGPRVAWAGLPLAHALSPPGRGKSAAQVAPPCEDGPSLPTKNGVEAAIADRVECSSSLISAPLVLGSEL